MDAPKKITIKSLFPEAQALPAAVAAVPRSPSPGPRGQPSGSLGNFREWFDGLQ